MCDHHQLRSPTHTGTVDHVNALSESLSELVENADYSDITLLVEGIKFPGHKVILAARSDYFRALLFGGMRESLSDTTEIELKNTSSVAFTSIINYVYTGKMNLAETKIEILLDVLGLTHQYGFGDLESAISDYLKANLDINNVCLIYDLANMYNLLSLCIMCKEFIDRNADDILQSDTLLSLSQMSVRDLISRDSFCASEIDIFKALRRWANYNVGIDPAPILDMLRLPLMSMQDLLNVVRPTGLLSPDAILDAIKIQSESRVMDLKYRGFLVPEENIATTLFSAQVIRGEMKAALLDGDKNNFDQDRGFTRHPIEENSSHGIVVRLGKAYIINTMRLLLWDRDMRSYSYIVQVSMDDKDYETVVDYSKYLCRSWQILHFSPRVVRYIKIVGTHNTVNRVFHAVAFEAYFTKRTFSLDDGLVVPAENIATIEASACMIEGVSRNRQALINGNVRTYDWDSGYTCHQVGSGAIVVQLAQPFMIDSMRLLLWDIDDRTYRYYIEVSTNQQNWQIVVDKRQEDCRSWQTITFEKCPVTFIKIVGTQNTANEVFHCVHFECPAKNVSSLQPARYCHPGPRVQKADSVKEEEPVVIIQSNPASIEGSEPEADALHEPEQGEWPETDDMDTANTWLKD